ncbi:MAG: nucleotidyltransferase domain-containing protein [Thermincola sp.]|jgi:predicted nucleotidyltransferase|nr:nucleotidyltransferase domain-containing protein [Thermincola sp.]MDT3704157.1 nucleotidyltransferase domain-containing protein [Thermincola sp.]
MAAFNISPEITKIAEDFAKLVKNQLKLDRVYLYGSYAKGFSMKDSDIDIAVVAEDFSGDLVEDTLKLMKIRRYIDTRIEPHPFTKEDFNEQNPYVKEIIDTGIRIV